MLTAKVVGRTIAAGVTVAALVPGPLFGNVTEVRAGPNTFVEVTPNTVQAGSRVNIRASCDGANNQQATVHSDAFGRVILRPDNGFLTASVTVPGSKAPGAYAVNLSCQQNGNNATTTLTVVNMSQGSQGPATGGGGTATGPGGAMMIAGGLGIVVLAIGFGMAGRRRRAEPSS
ncbi:hypothetical protein GCM10022225_61900 [Plantactinospora mayteni]|uniref:Sortase n=1 Tax=Plantactinospora mayteni TaxID=566021 RepID=A0ABQ4EZH8_9ACTN|nr:hypothetical protein [Plantactinospora mayteni]GIH00068.1 hypothetical protein Pma05_66400 [Plantactinospora mayteni]